ncbi:MAG: OpgC domain-containing protein [Rhodobacteraceae bacterium]|nr:OpgC domain-containing protein [Paracoccaceae bacterium]
MSRHDIAVPNELAQPVKRPRDPRIDAFRGLALLMIFVDHSPHNPFEYLTVRNIGFSDAAEAFFIMSGVAAGLAYTGRFQARHDKGLWQAVAPMWKRSWTLYLVQILLTSLAIAIFAAGATWFGVDELLTKINLRQVFNNTAEALIGIPLLGHQLGYVNILPAYSVLLFCGPLMILLGLWRPMLLLGLSAALWLAAGIWRINLPNYPNPGGWFFNPVAWQFIFVVGLLTGIFLRRGERFVPKMPWLFWLATGWLAVVLAWRYVPGFGPFMNHQMAVLGKAGLPFNMVSHDKTFLALPRMTHALALAYVLSCLPWVTRLTGSKALSFLRLLGRQGLLVFAAGTVLALFNHVIMGYYAGADWLGWVLMPLGALILIAVAWLGDIQKTAQRQTPARKAEVAAQPMPAE